MLKLSIYITLKVFPKMLLRLDCGCASMIAAHTSYNWWLDLLICSDVVALKVLQLHLSIAVRTQMIAAANLRFQNWAKCHASNLLTFSKWMHLRTKVLPHLFIVVCNHRFNIWLIHLGFRSWGCGSNVKIAVCTNPLWTALGSFSRLVLSIHF